MVARAEPASGGLAAWLAFAGLILARTSVSLQYQNVTVLGLAINVGSNCGTTGAITMNLSGPFGAFGGTLAGTYPITALSSCGGLTTLLNPVITGNGNKIALSLK